MATVAFQGERGAFSEQAAHDLLGQEIDLMPCRSFEDAFAAVSARRADSAMIPIENSLAGSVHRNYDLLAEHHLTIAAETYLRISMNLIARPETPLDAIRRVHSHPVALAQCQRFFEERPEIEALPSWDTAGSVKELMEHGGPDEAAIAGPAAAPIYGASVLREGIEDHHRNYTRFLLIVRSELAENLRAGNIGGTWKTSIVFQTRNQPGALFRSIAVFALRDLDLTKIESRPIEGRPWEYSFYLDLRGRDDDPVVARALGHLDELAESVRVLGSYPAGEVPA